MNDRGGDGRHIWQHARAQMEFTALIYAARYGHSNCAQLLLDAGVDTNAKDEVHLTVFRVSSTMRLQWRFFFEEY